MTQVHGSTHVIVYVVLAKGHWKRGEAGGVVPEGGNAVGGWLNAVHDEPEHWVGVQ